VAELHINASGGVLGRRVIFDIRDDSNDAALVVQQADALISEGVAGVLGATTSGQTVAIHQRFYDSKTLLISAGATTPSLSTTQPAADRYFFRTVPTGLLHGNALARLAWVGPPEGAAAPEHFDCRNMAVVYVDNSYGAPFSEQLQASFRARGGTIAGSPIAIETEVRASYDTEVQQIIASKPDCVSMVSYVEAGAQFLKDYRRLTEADDTHAWSEVMFYAGNTFNSEDLITLTRLDPADPNSPVAAEGVYGTNIDVAPQRTEFSEFRNLYSAMYPLADGENPPRNTANQFDAALLLALAIEQNGGLEDRVGLREALYDVSKGGKAFGPLAFGEAVAAIKLGQDVDYSGASGMVDFDDRGDVVTDFTIWGVESGEMTTVDRIPASDL